METWNESLNVLMFYIFVQKKSLILPSQASTYLYFISAHLIPF